MGTKEVELDYVVNQLREKYLKLNVTGNIHDFLGVEVKIYQDGTIHMTQLHLMQHILKELGLIKENVSVKETPMTSSKILTDCSDSPEFDGNFNYRKVIGLLN